MNRVQLMVLAAVAGMACVASAKPTITRVAPPSKIFNGGTQQGPVIARFLPGQRFDLQATVAPGEGETVTAVEFYVNNTLVQRVETFADADATAFVGDVVASSRAYSMMMPGVHTITVVAFDNQGGSTMTQSNFEIEKIAQQGRRAKNVIYFIGDGMGIAHRTAARLMRHGVTGGKADNRLAMDRLPVTGIAMTHSLNSIVTDSSPGAACYSTGNKSNNNQHGVFPDDTRDNFDNPRVEHMGEYLARTQGKSLGIVTTSDVFDATPASFATHTQNRGAGTGICDQFFDERTRTGLTVLMGGGRKWFLPQGTPGSARTSSNFNDYVLPADLASAWGVPAGTIDPARDLLGDFMNDGFYYAPNRAALTTIPSNATKLIGLFSYSNMNVALDKINKRRGASTIVDDYGFPDQPMLNEMTAAAISVLNKNPNGFVLMVEAASIDKQAHNMDTERWILDTIEFDDSIAVASSFMQSNPDTLVIVTADHECAGINIIGGSRVSDADLQSRIATGQGAAQVRNGVVGTYESAGFPRYTMGADGYPLSLDIDRRMLIGYAANADRYEDWRTNPQPLRDSQQPFNNQAPLNTYPSGPLSRDVAGNFLVTGQVADPVAAHTASDIPVSAGGRGAVLFTGYMDNTDVFFRAMQATLGGSR